MLTSQVPGPIFPSEILLLIGTVLEQEDQKETLSSLARTSRTAWKTLTPLLYRSVTIPHRNALAGVMYNFAQHRSQIHPLSTDFEIGRPRGLQLLRLVREMTLEAIPRVEKINGWKVSDSSVWHELRIFTNHHSILRDQKRLQRFTISGSAIQQLQLADPVAELSSLGYDQVTMPSDGLPPPVNSFEFTFLPQSGFTLATLIAYYQPLHLIIQYPLTWYQCPRPEPVAPYHSAPLKETRPYEVSLMNALEVLQGPETILCLHDMHDQCPPVGHLGAQHHISFISCPSVPILFVTPKSILPYVSHHIRTLQIKRILRKSNPIIPVVRTCIGVLSRPLTLEQWQVSEKGCWTFYRVGAMITGSERRDEWFRGANIEGQIRSRVNEEYSEEEGHPAGFAESINTRLKFVHGGVDNDPDELLCGECGHKCRIPVD
jgi:hypothetical protein